MSEAKAAINVDGLQALIGALAARGYKVLGPAVRDGAIVYDEIEGVADLPAGWTDHQDAGRYRLERRGDDALFGFAHGPQSWKRYLHPPMQTLWTAKKDGEGLKIVPPDPPAQKFAFIGARSCELHAIAIQDKVFQGGPFVDTAYAARRQGAFIVAVNCAEAGGTCFCVSMKTGPKAETGFDLALTEILSENSHTFLIEAGSEPGAELLAQLPKRPATSDDLTAAKAVVERTASRMGRSLQTEGIKALLQNNPNHPRWEDAAKRCLSCGNCTMVCPTCFCTTVDDSQRPHRRKRHARAQMGFLLHPGLLLHTRRRRATKWQRPLPAMDDAQARELVRSVRNIRMRGLRPLHHLVPHRHRHYRGSCRNQSSACSPHGGDQWRDLSVF